MTTTPDKSSQSQDPELGELKRLASPRSLSRSSSELAMASYFGEQAIQSLRAEYARYDPYGCGDPDEGLNAIHGHGDDDQ